MVYLFIFLVSLLKIYAMRKILSAKQSRELDQMTISAMEISSYQLMERAVCALFEHVGHIFGNLAEKRFVVVSGTGNNGGDGLGLARKLKEANADVEVWMCDFSQNISQECQINLDKLKDLKINIVSLANSDLSTLSFDDNAIIVDAIFGTGLSRSVTGDCAKVIEAINKANCTIVSIDIPSGLFADDNSGNEGAIVKANVTLSIQDYHLSAMFAEYSGYYGKVVIVDIGHDTKSLSSFDTEYCYIEKSDIVKLIKPRRDFDHKGTFGHALLVAGGIGKAGAAIMASRACMRTGVGLLTVHVPMEISSIMQVAVPEAMLDIDKDNAQGNRNIDCEKYSAVGIGPGIGVGSRAESKVGTVIACGKPMVMDADALNVLAADASKLSAITNCIMTPHPKEFERLFGKMNSMLEKLKFMSEFSRSHKSVIVLKGGVTAISLTDGRIVMYNGRNPGIATGGSGDVLTGVVTSLLAQGYGIDDAAIIGAWLHGEAGKLATSRFGAMSTLATDIIDCLPEVCRSVEKTMF